MDTENDGASEGRIAACPECNSSGSYKRLSVNYREVPYRCGHTFASPVTRAVLPTGPRSEDLERED